MPRYLEACHREGHQNFLMAQRRAGASTQGIPNDECSFFGTLRGTDCPVNQICLFQLFN